MRKKLGMLALLVAGALTTMLPKPALAQDGYYGGRNQYYQHDRGWDNRYNGQWENGYRGDRDWRDRRAEEWRDRNGAGANGASTNGVNARGRTTSTIGVTILVLPSTSVSGAD